MWYFCLSYSHQSLVNSKCHVTSTQFRWHTVFFFFLSESTTINLPNLRNKTRQYLWSYPFRYFARSNKTVSNVIIIIKYNFMLWPWVRKTAESHLQKNRLSIARMIFCANVFVFFLFLPTMFLFNNNQVNVPTFLLCKRQGW